MYCGIFICVLISETILTASLDNGFLNTDIFENNNTPTKYPTNGNVIRKWLERKNFVEDTSKPTKFNYVFQSHGKEDDGTDVSFRKKENGQHSVVSQKILDRWVSVMKNKSKNQFPILKANEQYYSQSSNGLAALKVLRELGFVDDLSSIEQEQLPDEGNNVKLTPTQDLKVPRGSSLESPWWMQSILDFYNSDKENVQLTTEPIESILLTKENETQSIAFNKFASNVEKKQKKRSKWPTGSAINSKRNNLPLYTTTENKLLKETDSINQSTERTIKAHKDKKGNREPTTANPSTQKSHALKALKGNSESTTVSPESIFQNWGLLPFDPQQNKLFDEEHDQLENGLQPEAQTLVESAEVDDDRNKALRQKVENWYDNLKSRREFVNLGFSPELSNVVRLRRNLQSAIEALSQKRQLSEWQRSHAVDYRKQSNWRRQLLSEHSMPQAVDYRRLLSLWRKELRRQLQIKWNRRPLVEISPGAFKTDIYVNPPDDLAKHMQKLLALKKRQEERNRDLNAGNPNAK